jgi:hypothetical protein
VNLLLAMVGRESDMGNWHSSGMEVGQKIARVVSGVFGIRFAELQ